MKVPFEWLKEFVVIDIDPYELAKRLTMRGLEVEAIEAYKPCLLYTSDAADDLICVDFGGRRIIKKKIHLRT